MKKIRFTADSKLTHIQFDAPTPASKVVPEWYKETPQFINQDTRAKSWNSTIKRCSPFLDALSAGYSYVLADDLEVTRNMAGIPTVKWRTTTEIISDHNPSQHPLLPIPQGFVQRVFKWNNEWSINTDSGFSAFFTHPTNRYDLPFLTFSGIVDTDAYTQPVQFPFILKEDFEGIIERGTPVAQIIPIKREAWTSEIVPYNEETSLKEQRKFLGKIDRSYKTQWWIKKTYN